MSETTRKVIWITLAALAGGLIYYNMELQMHKEQLTEAYQVKSKQLDLATKYLERFEKTTVALILANTRFHILDVENLDPPNKLVFLQSTKILNRAIFSFANSHPQSPDYQDAQASLREFQKYLMGLPDEIDQNVVESAYYVLYQATVLEEMTALTAGNDRTKILAQFLNELN